MPALLIVSAPAALWFTFAILGSPGSRTALRDALIIALFPALLSALLAGAYPIAFVAAYRPGALFFEGLLRDWVIAFLPAATVGLIAAYRRRGTGSSAAWVLATALVVAGALLAVVDGVSMAPASPLYRALLLPLLRSGATVAAVWAFHTYDGRPGPPAAIFVGAALLGGGVYLAHEWIMPGVAIATTVAAVGASFGVPLASLFRSGDSA